MIPKEEIYHEDLEITVEDVRNEDDIEKLREWRINIEDDIQRMNNAKYDAELKAEHFSEVIDPSWFYAIKTKKRLFGILCQEVGKRLQYLKKKYGLENEKKEKHETFCQLFVNISRDFLHEDDFEDIKAKALLMRNK